MYALIESYETKKREVVDVSNARDMVQAGIAGILLIGDKQKLQKVMNIAVSTVSTDETGKLSEADRAKLKANENVADKTLAEQETTTDKTEKTDADEGADDSDENPVLRRE